MQTLRKGTWKFVHRDGSHEIRESDGTLEYNPEDYAYVWDVTRASEESVMKPFSVYSQKKDI